MKLSPSEIIGQVACVTGVTAASITGKRKTHAVVCARILTIESIRRAWPQFSLLELAYAVGRNHHRTASHALLNFKKFTASNPHFRAHAAELNLL